MKKNLFIMLGIIAITILIFTFAYYNYQKTIILANNANKELQKYTQEEIVGSSLMTLINKVIDQNEKNNVQKDENKNYIENDENSIKIEIKFSESDKTFSMEAISKLGAEQFVKNYNNMTFKCTSKEYHEKTKKIKYLLFEQI